MSTTVLVSIFPPFASLALSLPSDTTLEGVYDALFAQHPSLPASADLHLTPVSGRVPEARTPLSALCIPNEDDEEVPSLVSLRLAPRMRGGKGGFGSQLRAAGGRMSSQKTSNNDSCRDLSGRRLSTIKEAKRLADYLESEPERKKAAAEAQRAKLETLERKLGIDKNGGPSGSGDAQPLAGKKHRFDDTVYLDQSREIVDTVKSAVSAGLLKKRKKAKKSHSPSETTPPKETAPVAPSVTTSALTEAAEKAAASASEIPSSSVPTAVGA
ncbi:hypothetical protein EWM64_g10425 [Hericium alpestre]|uniref:Uncharacterized protein n=1 Tax=Hericium alpestre TaxID=135208 RepID=A0A4Y9ZFQ3_9AGAM|nr:hypothetical protein EWM64_g10425 [Hericium alpestre]